MVEVQFLWGYWEVRDGILERPVYCEWMKRGDKEMSLEVGQGIYSKAGMGRGVC